MYATGLSKTKMDLSLKKKSFSHKLPLNKKFYDQRLAIPIAIGTDKAFKLYLTPRLP